MVAWVLTIRKIYEHNASIADTQVLAALFGTKQPLVTYQVRPGGMSHATVVSAAKDQCYLLTSQGSDGSLVFERATGGPVG